PHPRRPPPSRAQPVASITPPLSLSHLKGQPIKPAQSARRDGNGHATTQSKTTPARTLGGQAAALADLQAAGSPAGDPADARTSLDWRRERTVPSRGPGPGLRRD